MELIAIWTTAFMAGLLGSGHCFAMCGGIAGSLGSFSVAGKNILAIAAAIQFHFGRLLSYAVLGALSASVLGFFQNLSGFSLLGIGLRSLTALMVLLIGLQFLFDWRGLARLERWGGRVWTKISPFAANAASKGTGAGRLMLGLTWGFLPCGLVYTMLLTAASTGNALFGGSVMLAFGAGTLPSMLGLTLVAPALSSVLKDRDFRRFVGFSLILLALWMAYSVISMAGHSTSGHMHVH